MNYQKKIALNHSYAREALGTSYYDTIFEDGVIRNNMSNTNIAGLSAGNDSAGGYLVPNTMETQIIQTLAEENVIRRLATTIHTDGHDRSVPVVTSTPQAQWVAENQALDLGEATIGEVRMKHHKLGLMMRVSDELLKDGGVNIPDFLSDMFARSIGAVEENAFLNGNGITQPSGILTVSRAESTVIAAAPATITAEEIISLYYALDEQYRQKAVFMMHEDTAKALSLLKDENGRHLWRDALASDVPNTILGRPVYISRFMPKMAAGAKAVLFGDLSKYWIADIGNRSLRRYSELFADKGQTGFCMTERVDGKLMVPDAVKLLQMAE